MTCQSLLPTDVVRSFDIQFHPLEFLQDERICVVLLCLQSYTCKDISLFCNLQIIEHKFWNGFGLDNIGTSNNQVKIRIAVTIYTVSSLLIIKSINLRTDYKIMLSFFAFPLICITLPSVKISCTRENKIKPVLFCFSTRLHYFTFGEDKLHSGKQN